MKTHDERMHELLYSNDGRVEQCEYICKLEELVKGFHEVANYLCERWDECDYCEYGLHEVSDKEGHKCKLGMLNDIVDDLGIEVQS